MQATLNPTRSHNPFRALFFVLLLIVLAILAAVTVDYSLSHGPLRHPGDAEQVRECLNRNGAMQIWVNPTTGRQANLCQIAPGTFGIQIVKSNGDRLEEITAFIKQKMHRLDDVMRYLGNTGYTEVQ